MNLQRPQCVQPISRRTFVHTAGAFASSLFALDGKAEPQRWTPLGVLAAKKGIFFGFAVNHRLLTDDAGYAALVARECTMVTPENAMKWEAVHPAPDSYTFDGADTIVRFAKAHAIKLRGHTFCWHRALPPWVMRDVTKSNAEAVLRDHIATVAGRYRDELHSWDVVNEAIQLRDNQPNGLRNSFWYSVLGPAYLDIAFDAAHTADKAAILTYNDFGLEYEKASDGAKRKAVLAMLADLKKRGVPVQALGLQSHLRAGTNEVFARDLPDFISRVRDLGLQVFLTELDVDDSRLSSTGIQRDLAIADVYRRYIDLVLAMASVSVIVTWGAWDIAKATGAEAGSSKAERPLLFDPHGQPKLDAIAVAQSLQRAPAYR